VGSNKYQLCHVHASGCSGNPSPLMPMRHRPVFQSTVNFPVGPVWATHGTFVEVLKGLIDYLM